jgi:hypothetical protein
MNAQENFALVKLILAAHNVIDDSGFTGFDGENNQDQSTVKNVWLQDLKNALEEFTNA